MDEALTAYTSCLQDSSTLRAWALERVLGFADGAGAGEWAGEVRERYLGRGVHAAPPRDTVQLMTYRAIINYDFVRTSANADRQQHQRENNAYEELKCALHQLGWSWTETSAFEIQTHDISLIWRGVALVARQGSKPGPLSALNLSIQGGDPKVPSSLANFPHALGNIEGLPFPT